MQAHVDEIARQVTSGAHAVLIMDRAACRSHPTWAALAVS
jgi:hypothetical protein